jgi:hypothetical protein
MLSAGALLVVAPGVSSAAGEDGLDVHGWRIDQDQVAAASSAYIGTSLKVQADEGLGFSDPRPGQGDFESSGKAMEPYEPRAGVDY